MQILVEKGDEWMDRVYPSAAKVVRGISRRKTGFSNSEVKLLWEHGYPGKSHNENLWTDGTVLYSYATPVGVKCRNGILVNTHFYSITTASGHRPYVEGAVYCDFEILRNWISWSDLQELYILDREEDAALLYKDSGDNYYILLLRENGREYGIRLPDPCRTVEGAKYQLVPDEARKAISGGRQVKRQGEWFFVEFPEMDFPRQAIGHPLRSKTAQDKHLGNHIPRDKVAWAFSKEEAAERAFLDHSITYVFVRGTVRHAHSDHRMLRLGETWHLALRSPIRGLTASRGWD